MKTQRHEIEAWLGPALDDMTPEQVDAAAAASDAIHTRWPDPDLADTRETALNTAVQVILGEAQLPDVAADYLTARNIERARLAALTGALVATPGSERHLADQAGVARGTVRKALNR